MEKVEADLHAKRRFEEIQADQRSGEVERMNPELKALGDEKRSFGPRVLLESMKGKEGLEERVKKLEDRHRQILVRYGDILEEMNLPRDYTQVHYHCNDCKDTGYQNGKLCACLKKAAILETVKQSGIGNLLKKQRFDNFDLSYYSQTTIEGKRYSPRDIMEEIFSYCKDYAENFSLSSPSLLFIGGTGLGKTHLSSAIAGKVIEKGYDVVYESAPNVAALFEKERFESEEDATGTRRLLEAELLILDDLGTEPKSSATASAIYRLINHRAVVKGLPTIISTNLSYKGLEKQYDSAVLSRLLGEFSVKLFQGDDIRMAKLRR